MSTRAPHACVPGRRRRRGVPDLRACSQDRVASRRVPAVGAVFLPAARRRRVVALRVRHPSGTLSKLQSDVSAALAAEALYEPEKRPWLPHVTVARFRRPGQPFSLQNVNIGAFGVVRMVLYSSHLNRGGAVHTPAGSLSRVLSKRGALRWTKTRPWRPRLRRSSDSSARAASCAWATTPSATRCNACPTGSLALDIALGVGGVPRGRIVEIYGPESSGKTTLVLPPHRRGPDASAARPRSSTPSTPWTRVRQGHRRRRRRPPRLAARLRRAGARDRRDAGAQRRARHRRHRLGRRAHAQGRDRGRDGRQLRRPAGAPHEPGPAQARRHAQPLGHHLLSSPTSCARRSASCSATPRPPRAARR